MLAVDDGAASWGASSPRLHGGDHRPPKLGATAERWFRCRVDAGRASHLQGSLAVFVVAEPHARKIERSVALAAARSPPAGCSRLALEPRVEITTLDLDGVEGRCHIEQVEAAPPARGEELNLLESHTAAFVGG